MRKLQESRFKPPGHYQRVWEIVVEHGVVSDDLIRPGFYANISRHLRPQDKIVAMSDDQSVYAELVVLAADRTSAAVAFLPGYPIDLNAATAQALDYAPSAGEYEVKNRGQHAKWSIVRKRDGEVVKEGFGTKAEAEKGLSEYVKVLAA